MHFARLQSTAGLSQVLQTTVESKVGCGCWSSLGGRAASNHRLSPLLHLLFLLHAGWGFGLWIAKQQFS